MTIKESAVQKLHERAIYLVLDWSFLGTWRGVETKDTSSEVRASKRIIKSKAIEQIRTLRNKTRHMLGRYTLNTLFRPGVYAVPLEHLEIIEEKLKEAKAEIEDIRKTLVDEWPEVIKDAKERLGHLFDDRDYVNPESSATELDMTYRYIPIAQTPEILKNIAAETYQEDLERSKSQSAEELEAFRTHLRATFLQIIGNMRKTLTKPDGERRVFGKRFFKNLNSFLETFEALNFSEDFELRQVVESARKVANGYDRPEDLKDDVTMQKALNTNLEGLSHSLEGMVQEGRLIDLNLAS